MGERLDVGYAIDVLHPLAVKPLPMRELDQESISMDGAMLGEDVT
jgi:hypothetical protein